MAEHERQRALVAPVLAGRYQPQQAEDPQEPCPPGLEETPHEEPAGLLAAVLAVQAGEFAEVGAGGHGLADALQRPPTARRRDVPNSTGFRGRRSAAGPRRSCPGGPPGTVAAPPRRRGRCAASACGTGRRLRRHFSRNLLGPPWRQKERKIGDGLLPSAARAVLRPPRLHTPLHYAFRHGYHKRLDAVSVALCFGSTHADAVDSAEASGPTASRGSSRVLRSFPEDWNPKTQGAWPGRKPGRYAWYEIQDSVEYWEKFEHPKIVYQEIQFHPQYALSNQQFSF